MRRSLVMLATAAVAVPFVAATGAATAGASARPASGPETRYVVVYQGSAAAAHAALARLGAVLIRENTAVGVATVRTRNGSFVAQAAHDSALYGVAPDIAVGQVPGAGKVSAAKVGASTGHSMSGTAKEKVESGAGPRVAVRAPAVLPGAEPLSVDQWDMRMMDATPSGSYRVEPGKKGVTVGIIDTGVDGNHPDIKPNFDKALSRNFVTDFPLDSKGNVLDGPCEYASCVDPVDHDDDGHGTHVASTIGSPNNGIGIAGVAPNVRLVNIRAGQDSGYFFLQPTVDALTYAGQSGIDVVNMSFFTDPWLFNCRANPADSPQEQAQQRTIIEATQRAVRYARNHGVTLIAASGNESTDLGHPTTDTTSPDYPLGAGVAKTRTITNSCLSMPSEAPGVLDVNSVGRSGRLAYYSNYGVEQTIVAAPGGDRREGYGTPYYNAASNRILAAYPKNVGIAAGTIDPKTGAVIPQPNSFVVRSCAKGVCAYWQYIQGTSMASPHAVGVAALIVSHYGTPDPIHGGLTMSPDRVQQILERSAVNKACPSKNPYVYDDPELAAYHPFCQGTKAFNGFFGHGIVNALNAVTGR